MDPDLEAWLKYMNLERYSDNIVSAGYDTLINLVNADREKVLCMAGEIMTDDELVIFTDELKDMDWHRAFASDDSTTSPTKPTDEEKAAARAPRTKEAQVLGNYEDGAKAAAEDEDIGGRFAALAAPAPAPAPAPLRAPDPADDKTPASLNAHCLRRDIDTCEEKENCVLNAHNACVLFKGSPLPRMKFGGGGGRHRKSRKSSKKKRKSRKRRKSKKGRRSRRKR